MLEQLETYYRSEGILATNFVCPHETECRGVSEIFTGPKSAFVGSGYERGDLPRLLFLSLDAGWASTTAEDRLPTAVRDELEHEYGNRLPKKRHLHWYRTYELAWYILRQFDPALKMEQVNQYFAHANSAKCCQNKPDGSQADAKLFNNCRGYLAGELQVLRPHVVVTQGNWAKRGMNPIVEVHERIDKFACIARFDGRALFWLHTYHPRAFGYFYAQRDGCKGWERYSNEIKDFMDGTVDNID